MKSCTVPLFSVLLEIIILFNSLKLCASELVPIKEFFLMNGLKVVLHEDHRYPFVAVRVHYKTGIIDDPFAKAGMTNLMNTLMWYRSGHMLSHGPWIYYNESGATGIGSQLSTSKMDLYATVPAVNLETALWIESDRMSFLLTNANTFLRDAIEDTILDAKYADSTIPYRATNKAHWRALFPPEHPYHDTIDGAADEVDSITLDDVTNHYEKYYQPNNAILVLSGDINPNSVKALVSKYFAELPSWKVGTHKTIQTSTLKKQTRIESIELVGTTPAINISWITPRFGTDDDAIADFVALLLTRGYSGRLNQALHSESDVLSVQAQQDSDANNSVFTIHVAMKKLDNYLSVLAKTDAVLQEIQSAGLTESELKSVMKWDRLQMLQTLQTIEGKASFIQGLQTLPRNSIYQINALNRFQRISSSSVLMFIRKFLNERNAIQKVAPVTY